MFKEPQVYVYFYDGIYFATLDLIPGEDLLCHSKVSDEYIYSGSCIIHNESLFNSNLSIKCFDLQAAFDRLNDPEFSDQHDHIEDIIKSNPGTWTIDELVDEINSNDVFIGSRDAYNPQL